MKKVIGMAVLGVLVVFGTNVFKEYKRMLEEEFSQRDENR